MRTYNNLKLLLAKKGIKIKYLADKLGLKSATVTRKLQGKIGFSDKDINIILKMLEMQYEDVFLVSDVSIIIVNGEKYVVNENVASEVISILKSEVS